MHGAAMMRFLPALAAQRAHIDHFPRDAYGDFRRGNSFDGRADGRMHNGQAIIRHAPRRRALTEAVFLADPITPT